MNKEELLKELSAKIRAGEISRAELLNHLNSQDQKLPSPFSVTKILYILGAAIVIIGIIIFIAQIWEDIGSFGRIFVTLGLSLLFTGIGSMLLKEKQNEHLGKIFHFIGGMLIPGGAVVTLSELSVDSDWTIAITFGLISIFYTLLNAIHKHTILTFFQIANVTATIYLLLNAMTTGSEDIYEYSTMLIGISYILLAHSFRDNWNSKLISPLHFLGSIAFLGAAFLQVFDSSIWQIFYLFILGGSFYLSIYLKSRSILAISTIFLIIHVSYITSEYFADSIGWPISLVILGFVFIGLGYGSITINKKYITNS